MCRIFIMQLLDHMGLQQTLSLTSFHSCLHPNTMLMFVKYFWSALTEFLFRYSVYHPSAGHPQHTECTGATQDKDEVQLRIIFQCLQWQTNSITLNSFQAFISQNY